METTPTTVTIQDIWHLSNDESLTESERRAHHALAYSIQRYRDARKELARTAETVCKNMQDLSSRIANGVDPSSLGEVRAWGSEIDGQCAAIAAIRESIEALAHAFGYDREALIEEAKR